MLIDFEKAYDRIKWNFVLRMLESLGLPPFFRKMVQTLLRDALACVEINGRKSDIFTLSRSIRQGCPLAPALFVIVADALHYLLRNCSLSTRVMGIKLPNNSELLNVQFANDTAILLNLS